MKKLIFSALVLFGSMIMFSSCSSDELNDLQIDTPKEKSTDGDEPKPGCDDPNGCDDEESSTNV